MALLVYNKSAGAVHLTGISAAPAIPASAAPPAPGPSVNVTAELKGLAGGAYTALETQRIAVPLAYEWTDAPEYATPGLTINSGAPPGPHETTHATGGSDALTVASAATGITAADPGHTHTLPGATGLASDFTHETFLKPEAAGTSKATILPSSTGPGTISAQPGHPRVFQAVFDATWDGGNVTITGTWRGVAASDTFTSTPGSTVHGTKVLDHITSVTNSVGTGVGVVATQIQVDTGIGFADATSSISKTSVDGTDDGTATLGFGGQSFVPNTPANGTHNYEVWTAGNHLHTVTGPSGSTMATVNVTDPHHTHTLS